MLPIACTGDTVFCAADTHSMPPPAPPIPFPVVGNIGPGSPGSYANNKTIARRGDRGTHAACSGTNTFTIDDGSAIVFDTFDGSNKPVARVGDPTQHCGDVPPSKGNILTGAFTIFAD